VIARPVRWKGREKAMKIEGKVAVVTGAASGIGEATSIELAKRGVKALALVDRSDRVLQVARMVNDTAGRSVAEGFIGDTTEFKFRTGVFDQVVAKHGVVSICVPAAGITRDALAVKVDKETSKTVLYPEENFRQVLEVNLIAPVFWALEMVAHRRGTAAAQTWPLGAERKAVGHCCLSRIGIVAGQQGADLLRGQQSRSGRRCLDPYQGGDLPRREMCRHSSRLYRHAHGAGPGRGVHRQERFAVYPTAPAHPARRDRRRDLLPDRQLRDQWGVVG